MRFILNIVSSFLFRCFRFLSKYYFRTEIHGLENLPQGPALLVGNHNANPILPDTQALLAHYAFNETSRTLRGMAHDFVFQIPFIGQAAKSLGAVSCKFESGRQALADGHHVLVYPGGGWESGRPSRDRDQITFKGRSGFVRLAAEANVPLVPVVAAGAHDGWYVLTRGDRLAKWTGLTKLKIDCCPIALALPFGIAIGPTFPFLPLPRKIIIRILPALNPQELIQSSGGISQASEFVVKKMQIALDDLVEDLPRRRGRRLQ